MSHRDGGFLGRSASPGVMFAAGALLFPAFLLQQDIVVRAGLFAAFLILNLLSGRRVRVVQYLVVAAGIVIFNLVIPTGRVMVTAIGLPVTEGALKAGLYKATAMVGLIALSQFSIRSNLRLPGRLGGLIGTSLVYFERIMGEKRAIDRKDIVGSIDAVLLAVHALPAQGTGPAAASRTTGGGAMVLGAALLLGYGLLVLTLVHPRLFWG
jgi:hypothetical protein